MSLKPNEVKTPNIASYAVTESKLADNSVTTSKIKDGAVKTDKIGDKAVTLDKMADRSISTAKIIDGAITGIKIADGTITRDKISNGVLGRPLTPPVATVEIADSSVSEAKLQNNSVTKDKIKDGSVTGAKILDNTITASKIAANAVGASEIAANAVGYSEIASQSLEPRAIKTLAGLPPAPGQVPAYDESQGNLWWFKWVTPGAAARPLTPPITTDEIGDGQVTPAKLSFTPAGLTPIATVNLLNESSANDIDQVINLDAYIPAGANFALLQLRTSAGQLMASPTVSGVIWDDYVTEPVFLANLNQGMIEGSVVTQSGPARLYGPSAPARAIRVAHIKNGQIAITQVYLYGYA